MPDWKPHPDVAYTRLDEEEAVLLHLRTKRYYSLNETGIVIWEGVRQGHGPAEAAAALAEAYDVEQEAAAAHVKRFLEELEAEGLVLPEA